MVLPDEDDAEADDDAFPPPPSFVTDTRLRRPYSFIFHFTFSMVSDGSTLSVQVSPVSVFMKICVSADRPVLEQVDAKSDEENRHTPHAGTQYMARPYEYLYLHISYE